MFSFSMPELILILVIALVVFGPGKLPEVGKAIGKSLQEFRRATSGDQTRDEPIKVGETRIQEPKAEEQKAEEKK